MLLIESLCKHGHHSIKLAMEGPGGLGYRTQLVFVDEDKGSLYSLLRHALNYLYLLFIVLEFMPVCCYGQKKNSTGSQKAIPKY
jgi:hypothetical protein